MYEINLKDLTDASVANASVKWGMGGGSVTSIFGYLSSSDLLMFFGVVTTVLGLIVKLIYQHRRDVRASEEHKLKQKILECQLKHEQENNK